MSEFPISDRVFGSISTPPPEGKTSEDYLQERRKAAQEALDQAWHDQFEPTWAHKLYWWFISTLFFMLALYAYILISSWLESVYRKLFGRREDF
jgi:hypothetical protein